MWSGLLLIGRGLNLVNNGKNKSDLYEVLKVQTLIILDSSMVEHSAVNRVVVGSSPTRGVF